MWTKDAKMLQSLTLARWDVEHYPPIEALILRPAENKHFVFLKIGHMPSLFFVFLIYLVDCEYLLITGCSKPVVSEATSLSTESQPLPLILNYFVRGSITVQLTSGFIGLD